jgi:hypothetical protein
MIFQSLTALVFGLLIQAHGLKCSPYRDAGSDGTLCIENVCIDKAQLASLAALSKKNSSATATSIVAKSLTLGNWNFRVQDNGDLRISNGAGGFTTLKNDSTRFDFGAPKFAKLQIGNWTTNTTDGLALHPVHHPSSAYVMKRVSHPIKLWEASSETTDSKIAHLHVVNSISFGANKTWVLRPEGPNMILRDFSKTTDTVIETKATNATKAVNGTNAAASARYAFLAGRSVNL